MPHGASGARCAAPRTGHLAAALAAVLLLAGCGGSSPFQPSGGNGGGGGSAGGGSGNVSAVLVDPPDSSGPAPVSSQDGPGVLLLGDSYTGTFRGDVRVEVRSESGTWQDLGTRNGLTLQVQSDTTAAQIRGPTGAEAGGYTAARLTLEGAVLTLQAGSSIGAITLNDTATLRLGGAGDTVRIEKDFRFRVSDSTDSLTALTFDLNSGEWVTEQHVASRSVPADDLQVATSASAEVVAAVP